MIPLTGVVVACAALLAAGCADASQTAAPPSAQSSHAASAVPAIRPAQRKAAGRKYLAIAVPANHRLEVDFDGFSEHVHDNLAVAQAELRDAVATERQFDRRLLGLTLPPATAEFARLLVTANQARARLTEMAAASTSLAQLRGYQRRLTAANAPVEQAVRVIRSQLGLPPPETS
jgi:hypothetical protein